VTWCEEEVKAATSAVSGSSPAEGLDSEFSMELFKGFANAQWVYYNAQGQSLSDLSTIETLVNDRRPLSSASASHGFSVVS
jgi:hypothetical protein